LRWDCVISGSGFKSMYKKIIVKSSLGWMGV
jgi:hypothetical protein